MSLPRAILQSMLVVALVTSVAAPAHAQLGKPTGPPTWPTVQQRQANTVVTEGEMRRIEARLDSIESKMRLVSATPGAWEQHGELLAGMNQTVGQLRSVHRHLRTMFTDPALTTDRKAAVSFTLVYRELEAMTSTLQAMADATSLAVAVPRDRTN